MNRPAWFGSPLAATAAVMAGLCLIAIPLRTLTRANPAPARPAAVVPSADTLPAVLRLKLLAPAKITLTGSDGLVLLGERQLPAGETEIDSSIPLRKGTLELLMDVDFGDAAAESAVFLTVMPDGYEEQTRYLTGSGRTRELMSFDWHDNS